MTQQESRDKFLFSDQIQSATMGSKDDKENAIFDDASRDINDVPDAADMAETACVVDHIAERQLCRKFDVRLMPVLAIMCKTHAGCH